LTDNYGRVSIGETVMYVWRVWKNNRFAGYVTSPSQFEAYVKATEKYGQNVWVERTVEYKVVFA
jgi:hypothetical protein